MIYKQEPMFDEVQAQVTIQSAVEHGSASQGGHVKCMRCKRRLKSARSQQIGLGPVCAKILGVTFHVDILITPQETL